MNRTLPRPGGVPDSRTRTESRECWGTSMTVMVQESPSRGSDPDGRPDHLIRESEEARAKSGSGSSPGPGKGSYSVRQIAAAEPARMRTAYGHFIGCSGCLPAGIIGTGATLSGNGTPVHISLPRCADPGGKKGGSLPSTSEFPDQHGGAARPAVTEMDTTG